jgi:hypothetical protein
VSGWWLAGGLMAAASLGALLGVGLAQVVLALNDPQYDDIWTWEDPEEL